MILPVALTFSSTLILQVAAFRFLKPKSLFKWLGLFFVAGYAAGLAVCWHKFAAIEVLHFSIYYFALLGCYLVTFLNTLEPGPSFMMLTELERAGRLERADFATIVTPDGILHQRIQEMLKSGVVIDRDGVFTITPYGSRYHLFYTFYRRILGVKHKGG